MGRYDHRDYVSVTMEFRCNLRCVHCMIERTMDRLVPESRERFEALLARNARSREWRGLVLTGSEITLLRDLPDLARRARAAGFRHVRIQTHGMGLANTGFTDGLVQAGVDEFFVSVAGADPASHDAITGVPGSFAKMLAGLEHLDRREDIALITNTVVTARSYRLLPAVVERLAHLRRLAQMEFWVYFPMKEADERDLLVPHREVLGPLKAALRRARELGRAVEVKNFPECLLGEDGPVLVNQQPQLFIDPAFWAEFARNGFHQCVYRESCASRECLGLNSAYIAKYGFEDDVLTPLPPRGAPAALRPGRAPSTGEGRPGRPVPAP